jgi:CP family cyanate transporter-like MFS transporter
MNASYFSLNGFLPDYLTHTGRPDLIHGALTWLNLGQLPASFLLLASTERMLRTVWPYIVCAIVLLASVLMIVFLDDVWVIVGCGLIGFFAAVILVLVLALPPLLSEPADVHHLTAGVFTVSYTCAVVVPIVSGGLWDASGIPAMALLPVGVCTLVVIGLARSIVVRDNSPSTPS